MNFVAIFITFLCFIDGPICGDSVKSRSFKIHCSDPKCQDPIAEIYIVQSVTHVNYDSKLVVEKGDKLPAYGMPVDSEGFWYLEKNGKKGYVTAKNVKLNKNLIPNEKLKEVDVDPFKDDDIQPSETFHKTVVAGTVVPEGAVPAEDSARNDGGDFDSNSNLFGNNTGPSEFENKSNQDSVMSEVDNSNKSMPGVSVNKSDSLHEKIVINFTNTENPIQETAGVNLTGGEINHSNFSTVNKSSSVDEQNLKADSNNASSQSSFSVNETSVSSDVVVKPDSSQEDNTNKSLGNLGPLPTSTEVPFSDDAHVDPSTASPSSVLSEAEPVVYISYPEKNPSAVNDSEVVDSNKSESYDRSTSADQSPIIDSKSDSSVPSSLVAIEVNNENSEMLSGTSYQPSSTPTPTSPESTSNSKVTSYSEYPVPQSDPGSDETDSTKTPGVDIEDPDFISTPPPFSPIEDLDPQSNLYVEKKENENQETTEEKFNPLPSQVYYDSSHGDKVGNQLDNLLHPNIPTDPIKSSDTQFSVPNVETTAEKDDPYSTGTTISRKENDPASSIYSILDMQQDSENRGDKRDDEIAADETIKESRRESYPNFDTNVNEDSRPVTEDISAPDEDVGYLYSSVSKAFGYFQALFSSTELPSINGSEEPVKEGTPSEENMLPKTAADHGYCFNDAPCGGLERPIGPADHLVDQQTSFHDFIGLPKYNTEPITLSGNAIVYSAIISVVVLLFSLGYYYIQNSQESGGLIARVNSLNQELFVLRKERDAVEDQLSKIKENFNIMDTSMSQQDSKVAFLQSELQECLEERRALEETVGRLEKEIEMLMENGMEMHNLLAESISDEERCQILLANNEELKESLNTRFNQIESLTEQLDGKNKTIQMMQLDLKNAMDRQEELERKLKTSKADVEVEMTKSIQDLQRQIIKLQEVVDEKNEEVALLEKKMATLETERESLSAKVRSAEAGLAAAHGVKGTEAMVAWYDVTDLRSTFELTKEEVKKLNNQLGEKEKEKSTQNDKIKSLNNLIDEQNARYEEAEKEKVNALTKLQVLSDYFKEKENKLQEELGMKESLWLQKQSEDHTIYEQMKSLRDEISSLKSQNETLKTEILDQETSYKAMIQAEEQKTYDHWMGLRQSERKFKELQMEAAHFRNRLTQLEASATGEKLNPALLDASGPSKSNIFGVSAPSPPFMMIPPPPPPGQTDFFPIPPGGAMPPPPLPVTVGRGGPPHADRPPPLGRISSPPLSADLLPPPPLVNFDFIPPPPPPTSGTPPLPLFHHPQPRERQPKDSPPSNYSSESVNDKPRRRRR